MNENEKDIFKDIYRLYISYIYILEILSKSINFVMN